MFLNLGNIQDNGDPVSKRTHIVQFLETLNVNVTDLVLGDFDFIGEHTARKKRDKSSSDYKSGAYFRPNYERGILIYSLIKHFEITSMLEIGYGRGYSCFCAAKAFYELGKGKITTVDPALDESQINELTRFFPNEWFPHINFVKGYSNQFFSENHDKFDLIYIDGDHRYEAVLSDWSNSKERFSKLLIFDDYHLPGKVQKDIEVSKVVNQINDYDKELIIMDRRIFHDDRGYADEEINYGQVLIQHFRS